MTVDHLIFDHSKFWKADSDTDRIETTNGVFFKIPKKVKLKIDNIVLGDGNNSKEYLNKGEIVDCVGININDDEPGYYIAKYIPYTNMKPQYEETVVSSSNVEPIWN